jgi:hypothetical protein
LLRTIYAKLLSKPWWTPERRAMRITPPRCRRETDAVLAVLPIDVEGIVRAKF